MMNLCHKIFDCPELPVTLPEESILARLGRNRHLTRISEAERVQLRMLMLETAQVLHPCGRWTLLPVTDRQPGYVILDETWKLESEAFAAFVKNSPYLWLGAVTVGSGYEFFTRQIKDDPVRAVVADASASEIADDAMTQLQTLACRMLFRHNRIVSENRFSVGYGGLTLENQREIFHRLALEELGMSLSESFILSPEKSVTAFACIAENQIGTI